MTADGNTLFAAGMGFCAGRLAVILKERGWNIKGSNRQGRDGMEVYDGSKSIEPEAFAGVTHLLHSIPPKSFEDEFFVDHRDILNRLPDLKWVGYLSTTGVYGNTNGAWIDENGPLNAQNERSKRRIAAERIWLESGLPVNVFRLAGIYGPGRNALVSLKNGKARRIVKKGQVFSRIHVDDIVRCLLSSIDLETKSIIFNVCDDEPAPPQDVVTYAAHLSGLKPPPEQPFESADISPMARSFYNDNRRVKNNRIKEVLKVDLQYPDYRVGLKALADGQLS